MSREQELLAEIGRLREALGSLEYDDLQAADQITVRRALSATDSAAWLEAKLAEARREELEEAARVANEEPEPGGPMPHCPPEWSVEDVARAAVRATRSAIAGKLRALAKGAGT
jgi:hypothetical protein